MQVAERVEEVVGGDVTDVVERVVVAAKSDETDASVVARTESLVSRGAAMDAAVGVGLFVVGMTLVGAAMGWGVGTSVGIALFTSFMGGLGFGAMCGAVAAYNRDQAHSGH